ncbi:MAG: helix-turn-helix transcriptional regulator [Schleiferiaceae bacterium]|nr:helix-turn-helix transcriptional regulator [Schleiferiaceae bacterium]
MSTSTLILPRLSKVLAHFGENIKLVRLRRKLSVKQVAERAGINRNTLTAIEKGSPSVSLGNYAMVLMVLGLEKDLQQVAADDVLGRKIQDAGLKTRERAPKRNS